MAKKIIVFFLVLINVLTCCVGCKTESKELTVTVKKSLLGQDDFKAQEVALNNFIKAFNEVNPDIKVNINYVQEYPADLKDTDVVLLGADEMLEYAPKDLKDLTDIVSVNGVSQKMLELGQLSIKSSKKEQLFVPINYDRAVVYIDKGLFDHLGIEVPTASWTYDDFTETIQEVTKKSCNYDGYDNSVGIHLPLARPYVWKYFYDNLGDGWYDESCYVKFNTDKNLEVMKDVLAFYKKNAKCYTMTPPSSSSYKSITAMTWINACQPEYDDYRVISEELGNSLLGRRISSVAEKGNLILLPLPSVNGVNMSYSNTEFIKGFGISAYINESKLNNAIKLIEFAQTLEGNSALNGYYGGIPSCEALWTENYWKTGFLSGANADNVLIGIENDKRDDYADLLPMDEAVYEKNIRLRAICSNLLLEEIRDGNRNIAAFEKIMDSMARFYNSTITSYGVPKGYNPDLIAEEGV